MPDYTPSEKTLEKALELKVTIKPAENKHKKIGVWRGDVHICDCGAKNYKDYHQLLEMEKEGLVRKGYAGDKRRMYKIRHKYDRGETAFWTNKLLW